MNAVSMGVIEQSQGETGDKSEKDLISLEQPVMTAGGHLVSTSIFEIYL